MEKKILRMTTVCSGFVTLLTCLSLYFFPGIKETLAAEPEIGIVPENRVEVTVQQPGQIQVPGQIQQPSNDGTKEDATADDYMDKLNIQLPEGVHGGLVKITNDYLTQTVTVRFAKGVDDYSEKYKVFGSSDYIASLGYYRDGDAGVLEIQLDQVCELRYTYRENYLCIDLMDPHEIYDKVIVVDAGHGGRAPGAVKKGVSEKGLNLAVVQEIKALLDEEENIKVYYTRLDDTNPTLSQRVELANKAKADLFISIHHNSSASGTYNEKNGTMVLYNQEDNSEYSSKRFAEICIQNVMASAGSNRRGLAKGNYVYIVRKSQVPVALIEVGYMTNVEEFEKLQTQEYQKLVAKGVYNAVKQALEEGY